MALSFKLNDDLAPEWSRGRGASSVSSETSATVAESEPQFITLSSVHVVHAVGIADAHYGYIFANSRGARIKMIVHDGLGVWCAARRLNVARFVWPREIDATKPIALKKAQFDALVAVLPWQRLPEMSTINRL